MRNLTNRLAGVPLQAVGAALLLGAALMAAQYAIVDHVHSAGLPEPEQWIGRVTVQWYWVLFPFAFIALWARRRDRERRLGRVGAVMQTSAPLAHIVVTVAAIVWGGVLGKGDLPDAFMMIEMLTYVFYLGVLVSGVAFLLDKGARWWGAAVIGGLVLGFVVQYTDAVILGVFGVALIVQGLRRTAPLDVPETSGAR
ncbi:hypothetical protein [Planotetraspora mira]|jgi:hypothetical protein|uniref:Uncharacterized protein n=1 Tax=Planotetraspora mira TaxID=58121 RepID=A0A8J3TNN8_9ACTN|nr:hypothetical protein [Planotetraspora mira]GII30353.1 hypothetical protein Pmi06nite_37950 [Planotetraspora mira]